MAARLLGIVAVAAIILCTLLPFLPGRYDPLALPLSRISVAFGIAGLLVVPFAGLWLASTAASGLARWRPLFARTTLVAASIAGFVTTVTATLAAGYVLGACMLAAAVLLLRSVFRRRNSRAVPLYLCVVPMA